MRKNKIKIAGKNIEFYQTHALIIGSGAASLNAAVHLYDRGIKDLVIVTESLGGGTSNNSGSDKQTYYKLSVFGTEPDDPYSMAHSLYDGGAMHGDIALIEAICSAQCFFNLVRIGVPFPHNAFGGFVGYKTDHDPKQRATSAGPWTSNQMFKCLLTQAKIREIPIVDDMEIISLLTYGNHEKKSVIGAIALNKRALKSSNRGMTLFFAQNIVFGTGGPGGLYNASVYPKGHLGAIGVALEAGARAINLTESQYGLASTKFRWNVSGTYQQAIPRYISTDSNGADERDFLNPYFTCMGRLATAIFLKGYQWPFDPRKIPNYGSSLIDVLVYIETVIKKRRVFMDFRENPRGGQGLKDFDFNELEIEAHNYLKNSNALQDSPIKRLEKMNPMAIRLYKDHRIDISKEPLEIAVCAQHNNGGLQGNIWWESNLGHFFPVGEVNGTHGVYRPGGSALNSGQVGSLRAAQYISANYVKPWVNINTFKKAACARVIEITGLIENAVKNIDGKSRDVDHFRKEFQARMTNFGAHIRNPRGIDGTIKEAYAQVQRADKQVIRDHEELVAFFQNRHLCLAHAAYLESVKAYMDAGGGSRGSYLVLDPSGQHILEKLGDEWKYRLEKIELRENVLCISLEKGRFVWEWEKRRPIPQDQYWFENVWADFVQGKIIN